MHSAVKEKQINWNQVHRLVPSHFPPINLFENVSNPEDLEIVFAIESMTNDRIREEVGDLALVSIEDRISGIGTTPIMAAFTHLSALNSTRFTDNTQYGVYYGANNLDTAFAETIYHREKFLSATQEGDTDVNMRDYINTVINPLHDITEAEYEYLHGEDYAISQAFAKELRAQGSHGLLYNSVRNSGGQCVAVFKPKALSIPVQGSHYMYKWCGKSQRITNVIKLDLVK